MQPHNNARFTVIAIGLVAGLIGLGFFIGNAMTQNDRCSQLAQNYRALVDKPMTGTIGLLQSQATYEHACGTPQSATAADASVKRAQDDALAASQATAQRAAQTAADQQAQAAANAQVAAERQAQADAQAAQQKAQADAAAAAAAALGPDGRSYGTPAQRTACDKLLKDGLSLLSGEPTGPRDASYMQAGCPALSGYDASISAARDAQKTQQQARDAEIQAQTLANQAQTLANLKLAQH